MDIDFEPSRMKKISDFFKQIVLSLNCCYLKAVVCPSKIVADSTRTVAVQWQITFCSLEQQW